MIDDELHPMGVVSLRDIGNEERTVSQVMTYPAECVDESDTIEHADVRVVRNDIHQLVVVGEKGVQGFRRTRPGSRRTALQCDCKFEKRLMRVT